jgi:uncharacterized protein YndB with AHSA1/START domain
MPEEVRVTRVMAAPPAEVYEAWTNAEAVSQWFAPGPMTASVPQWDVRVGGAFRVEMYDPRGSTHIAIGRFQDLQPSQRLVFSFGWEGVELPETVVRIELSPVGEAQTELTLIHQGLPTPEDRDAHRTGWTGIAEKLAGLWATATP